MKSFVLLSIPLGLILFATGREAPSARERVLPAAVREAAPLASRIDVALEGLWKAEGLTPVEPVDDLQLARRLWLDLLGTVPSLEEVREIERRAPEGRRAWLVDRALSDPRFPHAFAERLVRVIVGDDSKVDDLLYRRRRLVSWLEGELARHRPWDQLARELIAAEGISTGAPAVNYVMSQEKDPIKLAARTTRAFLGVRIDCAQCHDHPFAEWKQEEFHGLAAFFARVEQDLSGISEGAKGEYYLEPGGTATVNKDEPRVVGAAGKGGAPAPSMMSMSGSEQGPRKIAPGVPFDRELLPPNEPGRRQALAAWVTHPGNDYFARAIVNRLWSGLLGRGFVEPADELDVSPARAPELLELLAADLTEHGFQLERTVRAIVLTRAYGLSSRPPEGEAGTRALESWAAFPLKPLRADQLGAATLQTTSFWTYDQRRGQLVRFAHFGNLNDFVKRHGEDPGAETAEAESLLQRLHLLNGAELHERLKDDDLFSPATRLPALARDDAAAVEAAFLMTLTRRPSERERALFLDRLARAKEAKEPNQARSLAMADLLWALVNTTEFAWNH